MKKNEEVWTDKCLPQWVRKYFGNRYDCSTNNPFKRLINWFGCLVWNGVAKYQIIKKFGWEAW